jgi:hypothetical protein
MWIVSGRDNLYGYKTAMSTSQNNFSGPGTSHGIELRLNDINQLFNSMDPSPFREKDLDLQAEEFIVDWARELHKHDPLYLTIHLGKTLNTGMNVQTIGEAVRNHFKYRANQSQIQYGKLLREGWKNLVIGLTFLSLCLFLAQFLGRYGGDTFITILKEGLIIGGWVAMWRPMEIFLYSRWPIKRMQKLYTRLANMEIRIAVAGESQN